MVNLLTHEKHIQHNYGYKQLTKNTSIPIHSTKVKKSPTAFINYLQREPRTILGTNNNDMKLLIPTSQLVQEEQKEQSTSQEQQKKRSKLYLDTENLLELMEHYKTAEKIQLLQDVTNQHHLDQLTSLIRSHNWNIIYRKSQEEYKFMTALTTPTNYYNIFIEHRDDTRQKTMSYEETTDFMLKWTLKQNIDLRTFILQVYMILRKYHPQKIHCIFKDLPTQANHTYQKD